MEHETINNDQAAGQKTLVQDYLVYLRDKKNRSGMTLDSYDKDLEQFVVFLSDSDEVGVNERILALSSGRAQEFVDDLIARQFTVSTISRKVTAVRGFYRYLQTTGRICQNPFEHAYVPQRHTPQVEYLQPEELSRLFETINGENWLGLRDRAIVALLYNTGMRISELLSLTPAGIDLEEATVVIQLSGQKTRTCQLQGWVVKALSSYLDSRRRRNDGHLPQADGIFVNRDGGQLTARSIRRKLKHYSRQAELPVEAGPAILRHSCAMHMLMDGVEVKAIRAQLGHLSASSMRPYLECLQHQNAPVEPSVVPAHV